MFTGKITRRRMLRGAGVLMSLPLLESLRPLKGLGSEPEASSRGEKGSKHPIRFAALYMPNGVNAHHWTPKGDGANFELSSILEPLAPHKSDILVLTHLWNAATNTGDGHYVKTGGWLTSTTITRTTGNNLCAGNTSMDQLIEPPATGVDTNVGFTQLYGAHISWSTPTNPLPKEVHPKLAFDRLFRSNPSVRKGGLGHDQSVLDLVAEDARRLQRELGSADRQKLNEYFESVRSVEKRIEFETRRQREQILVDPLARKEIERLGQKVDSFNPFRDPGKVSERGVTHTEHVRLMLDILTLAFWTDSTRVSTFMFGNAVSGRNFSFLDGVKGGHHEYSHHENRPEKLAPYERITRWHIEQYAYFLGRLRSMNEGTGSVLDQSMILFGAGMRDGNGHNPRNLPLVLAGRGGGTLNPGRHLVFSKDSPMANLHLGLMRRMGVRADRFADSTNALPELGDAEA